ncbi:HNH endonuclease [Novilysobacter defluvii]|uniref:HNH endonuclease n=1 Tax=Novilysobacter defluvii TaxID=391738 RepID=UPI001E392BD2|nr:HNH endonuclease [Lysobacter defluvii]
MITIDSGRQYGGNDGYEENPSAYYTYDSRVPNHKQLAEGDVVFVRNATHILGAALVESVSSQPGSKMERRCPSCGAVNVRERKSRNPAWRCSKCRAEFENPVENIVDVRSFTAHYGKTFRTAPPNLDARLLKQAAASPNDQLAIERLDVGKLAKVLGGAFLSAGDLLRTAALSKTLDPGDADASPATENPSNYAIWEGDEREAVLRSIRIRRGQQSFRRRLIRAYGGRCAVSGCELLDLLEAAHISPYKGAADHHLENGLLLRADLHTLFDLGHLAIEPITMTAKFSKAAALGGYAQLDGTRLTKPLPSAAALQLRWSIFVRNHMTPCGLEKMAKEPAAHSHGIHKDPGGPEGHP